MKTKLLSLFVALVAATTLWANNTITYSAMEKLRGGSLGILSGYSLDIGKTTFGPTITSHTFSDSKGTITCDGEITMIGENAFCECTNLTSIEIPNSVKTIGRSAFSGCSGLTSITIPNSVTTIGDDAFAYCTGLTSVTIPNSVTTIGKHAFYDCSGLTSVTIPNSVTTIEQFAFQCCTGLTSITISNSVTTIGIGAFDGVNNIVYNGTATGSPWGAKCVNGYVDGYLVYSDASKTTLCGCSSAAMGEITIPNFVTTIGAYAFRSCYSLTSITIPNSVTTIGEYVFSSCKGLTSIDVDAANTHYYSIDGVLFNYAKDTLIQYPIGNSRTEYTIPNSITTIGNGAFEVCTGLTTITIPNSVTSIGKYAFSYCEGLTSVTIPNTVTTIGNGAFYGCSGLLSITIPNSVTTIGNHAFDGCSSLISVTIPSSVTTIEQFAFSGCSGLTSVTIPNSVTTIGYGAFSGCSGLTSMTIPNSVTTIGEYAFSATDLTSITCYALTPPECGYNAFQRVSLKAKVYVPASALTDYQNAEGWKDMQLYPIAADVTPMDNDNPIVTPTSQDVTITWPITDGTDTYTLTITKNGETVCVLTFNANGQLTNIAFAAPGHNGAHQAPAATLTAQGYQFTVTGLNPGTAYDYSVTATDASGQTIAEHKGNFSTTGGESDLQNVRNGIKASKYFHNGNLIIERNGIKYTPAGQRVR